MKRRVAVTKMHGARNDFVVVDARIQPLNDPIEFARTVCDRHAGVGADGLLIVENAGPFVSMRVINADGSEAEMCGNGVRCIARYLDERDEGADQTISTKAGLISTSVIVRGPVYRVRVDMGIPRIMDLPLPWPHALAVDTGNPHVVLFVGSLDEIDLAALGERMQSDPLFPNGVNVHLAAVRDPHAIDVAHYERGAGLTMACGTGAVACAKAAIARGLAQDPVTVSVPGGDLLVEFAQTGSALMTGPAERVFETVMCA
jgi:diaminopimelate epimerase